MQIRVAAIIVGIVAAAAPALAKDAQARKPAAHAVARPAAVQKPAAKKSQVAALPAAAAPATAHTGTVHHPRSAKTLGKRGKARRTGSLDTQDGDILAPSPNFSGEAVGWRLIEDPATGVRLGLPEKLVPRAGASRTGSRWSSAQGQIQIETFRLAEAALPALFEEEKKASHRQIASSELKPDSFVIIGVQGLKNFLVRAQARGSEVRGITVLYDQATAGIMGPTALAMASAFAGFPDLAAAPPPGMRRTVEYGTAIVVSSGGDLIAPGQVTDGCQAITVPPLGHAERVAEDKANDLALIRVYGARNLVPQALAGDSGQADGITLIGAHLTLIGVADPLAQAGGGAVTSAAASVTVQGIDPAPKLGFSGAAAVDASGRFAGMVNLKPTVVAAGSGSIGQQAALVPAEVIHTFLQAQGLTLAAPVAGQAAIEQSVVRVICVRK